MKKLLLQLQKYFTPKVKTRAEIINQKVSELMQEILINDFTNEEISLIIRTMREDGIHELKRRSDILNAEIQKTIIALNKL
jgi:hypothetical protein